MKTLFNTKLAKHLYPEQVFDVSDDFAIEVCLRQDSKNTAFHLRYRAYLAVDAISGNPEELLYDEYDFQDNARIFLVWFRGKPVATVRSCVFSDRYNWLPTEGVNYFRESLEQKLGDNTRLLESNRFAVDPDFQGRQSLVARFLLFRAHGLNAAAHNCSHIITSVRDNHRAFYLRFLGMPAFSENPIYIPWANAEVYLLANKTEACLENILKRGMPDYSQDDVNLFIQCARLTAPVHLHQSAA